MIIIITISGEHSFRQTTEMESRYISVGSDSFAKMERVENIRNLKVTLTYLFQPSTHTLQANQPS